jgi:protein-S-isoprenylcysteine O-methyltransferase Ste14
MGRPEVLRIVYLLWMAIFVIWAIASLWVKRTTESSSDASSRIAVWAVTIAWWLVLRPGTWQGVWGIRFVPEGAAGLYAGFVLTIVGLAFAVWSRFYIGRNWDGMVVLKQDHQLMRRGPYGIVRHPIYSGFMLATLGTAMVQGEAWRLSSVALIVIAWGYKARMEEKFLIQRFGEQYEQYRREVKALVPAVW